MERQEYEELIRRLVVVSEQQGNTQAGLLATLGKMDERQADMQRLLGRLTITYQRLDGSLTFVDEAMGTQTTILAQQQTLLDEQKTLLAEQTTLFDRIVLVLERHEETFERLWRLLDERLPPGPGQRAPGGLAHA